MNVLDLFSGACGGWSLGLHRAGLETVAACESDEWRRLQFARNFPRAFLYDDVCTLTAKRLRDDGMGTIDLICGSPPCQDASTANTKGRGIDGERTGLYLEAVRIVLEVRSRWFAFENVPGIRNRGIDRVLGKLEEGGYTAWPLVVGASDLGAPHIRKRSWVIGADAATVQRLALPWDKPDRNSERVSSHTERERVEARQFLHGRKSNAQGPDHADASRDGRGSGRARRPSPGPARQQRELDASATDAESGDCRSRLREAGKISDGTVADHCAGTSADPNGNGIREPKLFQKPVAEAAELERAIAQRLGRIGEDWNGGIAGCLSLDDGLPKGMARPLLAAFGDSVVPQISEIIGRAIMAAEGQ